MAKLTEAQNEVFQDEQLKGRSYEVFYQPEETENLTYPGADEVDFEKKTEFDAAELTGSQINLKIRELMGQGYGSITVNNPLAKHSVGIGILNRLNLHFCHPNSKSG